MSRIMLGKLHALAVLFAAGVVLSACNRGAPEPDAAEVEAGRENVEAMAGEHVDDTTDPSPGAEVAPARDVIAESRLPYAESGDELVYGHFAAPSDVFEPLPALIVIHEWWGLNDNVRAMADRLAGEGYMVLAVDLYGGKIAATPEEARALMLEVVEDPEPARENIRAAYQFLMTAGAPRIGSVGWCFGGGWSLNTAMMFPEELDATVIYYGAVTDDADKLLPIASPILGLFGAEDTGIKVESVESFRATLQRLRKVHEVHIYPGAGHAFANPTGNNYNAKVAEDAWERTTEFLARHLLPAESDGT